VGNLTDEPQLRFTNSGLPVVNFTVAVNEGSKEEPRTSFYDVAAWRSLAQNVADTLHKGNRVVVFGTLAQRSWETTEGQKRSKIEVTAEAVGPDLRFATAHVQAVHTNAPAAQAAPQPQGYPDAQGQPRDFREEPF
jgi:single-strand DNA-binding protein